MRFYAKFGNYWILIGGDRMALVFARWPWQKKNKIFAVSFRSTIPPHNNFLGTSFGMVESYSIKECKRIGVDWISTGDLPSKNPNFLSRRQVDVGKWKLDPDLGGRQRDG